MANPCWHDPGFRLCVYMCTHTHLGSARDENSFAGLSLSLSLSLSLPLSRHYYSFKAVFQTALAAPLWPKALYNEYLH